MQRNTCTLICLVFLFSWRNGGQSVAGKSRINVTDEILTEQIRNKSLYRIARMSLGLVEPFLQLMMSMCAVLADRVVLSWMFLNASKIGKSKKTTII